MPVRNLDPLAVANPRLHLGSNGPAVLVSPVAGSVSVIGDCRRRDARTPGRSMMQIHICVNSGQEVAAGVAKVDLGAERAALHVERPGHARDSPRDRLVAIRLREHGRLRASADVVGVLLRNIDEDPDDVDAVDHEDRRGHRAGRNIGRKIKGRGVASRRQHEVESVGVPRRDHAIERSREREIVDPRLGIIFLAFGHFQVGFGDPDFHLGFRERGLGVQQFRLRPLDRRLRLVSKAACST